MDTSGAEDTHSAIAPPTRVKWSETEDWGDEWATWKGGTQRGGAQHWQEGDRWWHDIEWDGEKIVGDDGGVWRESRDQPQGGGWDDSDDCGGLWLKGGDGQT